MQSIINNYTLSPRDLTKYNAFRGITDFTQIAQFAQYEKGYNFLHVIEMPRFLTKLGEIYPDTIGQLVNSFKHMLQYEFRGLDGLPDITGDTMEITDGVNTQRLINKVTRDTAITISSNYWEKTGGLITKFSELYLTGIKDLNSEAKTYHGLVKGINGYQMEPGPENEVFTLLYFATDNTYLRIEKAFLLCNCQLTKVEESIYNGEKGTYDNVDMNVEFNCFPITGLEVDKAAYTVLNDITGAGIIKQNGTRKIKVNKTTKVAALETGSYKFGILNGDAGATKDNDSLYSYRSQTLIDAANKASQLASGR